MDAVAVVLGNGFEENRDNPTTWNLSADGAKRAEKAAELFRHGAVDGILNCGLYSVWYRQETVKPSISEAALLQKEEIEMYHIPEESIYQDDISEDTITNAIVALQFFRQNEGIKTIHVICGDYNEERVGNIFRTIITEDICRVEIVPIKSRYAEDASLLNLHIRRQNELWQRQKPRLESMLPKIHNGEVTAGNFHNSGAYLHESSQEVKAAARGLTLASQKR